MTVLDISVPTGFAAVRNRWSFCWTNPTSSVTTSRAQSDVYIEDMDPGETVASRSKARALYPVRAKAPLGGLFLLQPSMERGDGQPGPDCRVGLSSERGAPSRRRRRSDHRWSLRGRRAMRQCVLRHPGTMALSRVPRNEACERSVWGGRFRDVGTVLIG